MEAILAASDQTITQSKWMLANAQNTALKVKAKFIVCRLPNLVFSHNNPQQIIRGTSKDTQIKMLSKVSLRDSESSCPSRMRGMT